jgi:hypothetical protein
MNAEHATELVEALEDVRFGDVLLDEDGAWCVAVEVLVDGPDQVRSGTHPETGPWLEITVTEEMMRRAMLDEFPALYVHAVRGVDGGHVNLHAPVRRVLDPVTFLRMQPCGALLAALMAFHATRDGPPSAHTRAIRALEEHLRGLD